MGYCRKVQLDCLYTDRDNNDNCSLEECKYMKEIIYKPDRSLTTKLTKTKDKKAKEETGE